MVNDEKNPPHAEQASNPLYHPDASEETEQEEEGEEEEDSEK